MNKQLLKDSLGWGLALWFIGYVLSIILIFLLPVQLVGWVIMPIGVIITFWVLLKKVKDDSFQYYLILAVVWTVIAVLITYLLLKHLSQQTVLQAGCLFILRNNFYQPAYCCLVEKQNLLRIESPDKR